MIMCIQMIAFNGIRRGLPSTTLLLVGYAAKDSTSTVWLLPPLPVGSSEGICWDGAYPR